MFTELTDKRSSEEEGGQLSQTLATAVSSAMNSQVEKGDKAAQEDSSTSSKACNIPAVCGEIKDPNVKVSLQNKDIWDQFHASGTEMIITKAGRYY